jgi:DNA N-6-adenine-methyltransferase (Dam)
MLPGGKRRTAAQGAALGVSELSVMPRGEQKPLELAPSVAPVESNERYTPPDVLEVVRRLGPIAFDPCTPPHNPCGALRFVAPPHDGLTASWIGMAQGGLGFINPPYSRGQILLWVRKMVREGKRGCEAVMLLPQDLSTGWGQLLIRNCQALCFWKGRISYIKPDGHYETGAKQPSLFAYFGPRPWGFYDAFIPEGAVLTRGGWG